MKCIRIAGAVGLVGVVCVSLALPAFGSPSSAQSPHGTLSCAVPDVYLDGPGAVSLVATCAYTKIGDPSRVLIGWTIEPEAPDGTAGPGFDGLINITAPASGISEASALFDGRGAGTPSSVFQLTGEMDSLGPGDNTTTPIAGGAFTVWRSTSRISNLRIKNDSRFALPVRVSAKVTAVNSKGKRIPVDGSVVVEVKAPGGKTWGRAPDGNLDARGNFEAAYPKFVPGTQIRVSVIDCGWCTDTSATGRAR